jgi:hypothetical protein
VLEPNRRSHHRDIDFFVRPTQENGVRIRPNSKQDRINALGSAEGLSIHPLRFAPTNTTIELQGSRWPSQLNRKPVSGTRERHWTG